LVDMDFLSPKLSSKVEPEFEIGLSNYLMSECDLQTIIKPTEIDTLHFVNAGNADGHKEMFYNNKKELINKIILLKENKTFANKLSKNSHLKIKRDFSWDKKASNYLNVI